MSGFKGDYLGFTYNGKHSSDLGIVRTSNGSRFDENLLPTMQDKTVQVPGGDGTYYFGSYYTQRPFSVPFAFDNLTEKQIAEIKAHFGDKKNHDLIFDERPYKIYRAKVTGSATMKYIPFSEGSVNRIYKGEGTIQFTCYDPFARCDKKWLNEYVDFDNINEWKEASGLKEFQGNYDILNGNKIPLWNPGDLESYFQLRLNFIDNEIPAGNISINDRQLHWEKMIPEGTDTYVKINTRLNLIEGYNSSNYKTSNVYNKYITTGDFFKIPIGESEIIIENCSNHIQTSKPIEYVYYYF